MFAAVNSALQNSPEPLTTFQAVDIFANSSNIGHVLVAPDNNEVTQVLSASFSFIAIIYFRRLWPIYFISVQCLGDWARSLKVVGEFNPTPHSHGENNIWNSSGFVDVAACPCTLSQF